MTGSVSSSEKTLGVSINHHKGSSLSFLARCFLFLSFFPKHIFYQHNVKKQPVGEGAPDLALERFPILNRLSLEDKQMSLWIRDEIGMLSWISFFWLHVYGFLLPHKTHFARQSIWTHPVC